jgi:hypothetical protein
MAKQSWKLLAGAIIVIVFLLGAFISYQLRGFSQTFNRFSVSVKNYDRNKTTEELENLRAYYSYFSKWHLRYFADRFLLKDMYYYEAIDLALREDYEGAGNRVKDKLDDYRASYLTGIVKFKLLRASYHSEAVKKDPEAKKKIEEMVLDQVNPDFRRCLEVGPSVEKNFNCSYNFDVTSNPEAIKKALEGIGPKGEFILGFPRGNDGNQPGKQGDKRLLDPQAGQNETRRKG